MPLLLVLLTVLAPQDGPIPADLLTVAEASDFTRTARYDEVIDLIDRIESRSTILRRASLGQTVEDRSIPLIILADPPIETAAEARASGKGIVFAFGNIHAGEVCGKEALLMLAREWALDPPADILDHLVLVLAPVSNADGNERMSPENRPGQVGPDEMGQRANAAGLDLNRDYVKLEAPETRALVRFLTEWDPHITIDTHTTDGSHHRLTLTYEVPLNPSGHPAPVRFLREELLPAVTERLREETGYETFFYGNFNRDQTTWSTYSAQPRYGGPYVGLRGQMSILSEAYAYASYRDRILCTREFLRAIIEYAAAHREAIIEIHERARRETIGAGANPQPDDVIGIRHRLAAFTEPVTIPGYRMQAHERGRPRPTEVKKDYQVVHLGRFEAVRSVRRPFAYVIPRGLDDVVENLTRHGIALEPFSGPATVEVSTISDVQRRDRPFQGHRLVLLEAEARIETRSFPDGSRLLRTAQPLGTLAAYLLEPESEDGLAAWNMLDEHIDVGREYPIARVRCEADLK